MNTILTFLLNTWARIKPYFRNKYILTITLVLLWITFLDRNNLIERFRMVREVYQLENDCEYYRERIVNDSARLVELHSSPEMLEKYAREQYLMKRDNEDIFVIVDR